MAEVHTDWAQQIIKTAAIQAGDDEIRSRVRCVEDTYKKYGRGEKIKGWTSLGQLIDGKAAKALRIALAAKSKFPDLTKDGTPRASVPNTVVALELLGYECSHDLFKHSYIVGGHEIQEFGNEVSDAVLLRISKNIYDNKQCRFYPTDETTYKAVKTLGDYNRFHPVLNYLDSLKWDGVERLDTWLINYGG